MHEVPVLFCWDEPNQVGINAELIKFLLSFPLKIFGLQLNFFAQR